MCEGGLKAEVEWEESSSGPICGFQRTSEEEEPGEQNAMKTVLPSPLGMHGRWDNEQAEHPHGLSHL